MFTYIHGIVQTAHRSGVLYTTSDLHEGYLMLSGEGAGGAIGFWDGMKMIAAEKKALGGFRNMKCFIDACFSDGGTIETRMRKEKKKFLRIEMLVVRKEFQGLKKQAMQIPAGEGIEIFEVLKEKFGEKNPDVKV